ncbi:hypothetical protein L7F22_055772 [Adiantum nelumboides]|nr:hypothetical protein [Adiantum nelumboides]
MISRKADILLQAELGIAGILTLILLFSIIECITRFRQWLIIAAAEGDNYVDGLPVYYYRHGGAQLVVSSDCVVYMKRAPSAEEIEAGAPLSIYAATCTAGSGGDPCGAAGAELSAVECSICLEELQEGQRVRRLPACSHTFHALCIDRWFSQLCLALPFCRCPCCRKTVAIAPQWVPARVVQPSGRQPPAANLPVAGDG